MLFFRSDKGEMVLFSSCKSPSNTGDSFQIRLVFTLKAQCITLIQPQVFRFEFIAKTKQNDNKNTKTQKTRCWTFTEINNLYFPYKALAIVLIKSKYFHDLIQSDLIGTLKRKELFIISKHNTTTSGIMARACTDINYLFPFLLGLKHKKREFRREANSAHAAHIIQKVS